MEKINITIPNNLTPQEELLAIAKQLGKKMLPAGKTKLLGSGYEIQDLQTQVTITREAVEKPIVTIDCSACGTVFEKSIGKVLFVNYGGKTRQRHFCSEECCQAVIDIVGEGRASMKRSGLKPMRFF